MAIRQRTHHRPENFEFINSVPDVPQLGINRYIFRDVDIDRTVHVDICMTELKAQFSSTFSTGSGPCNRLVDIALEIEGIRQY